MAWYNPLDWFRTSKPAGDIILYCDNPQCKAPIEDGPVAYDDEHREIYHNGECGLLANVHRAHKSGSMVVGNVEYVDVIKAVKLFRKGKLNQSSKKLEERV